MRAPRSFRTLGSDQPYYSEQETKLLEFEMLLVWLVVTLSVETQTYWLADEKKYKHVA